MKGCVLLGVGALSIPMLLLVLLVAVIIAPLAGYAGSQTGTGWAIQARCMAQIAQMATPAVSVTPIGSSADPTRPACLNLVRGNQIVAWAALMAAHLYGDPDVWYDQAFPPQALAYWARTCPACVQWQRGNLQCVMFAAAAYGLAGLPLYFGPNDQANAIDFWGNYARRPGWIEVYAAWAAPGKRGLPAPGDLMIWDEAFAPTEGHMAIVLAVAPPQGGVAGSITFAEANGPAPVVIEPLLPNLLVATWPGGQVVGYIRYIGTQAGGNT